MMHRQKRLQNWIDGLDQVQLKNITLVLVEHAIDSEFIRFWDDTNSPYFNCSGETLDGSYDGDE